MVRAFMLASCLVILAGVLGAQALPILHVRIWLVDATGAHVPLPRHALLISDNPSTAAPRRVVTGPDGTVDVRLRAGNYTVESDEPVAVDGRAYEWRQTLDMVAGLDPTLELTPANAVVTEARPGLSGVSAPENDPSLLLPQWQGSVVAVWSPVGRLSGFIADASGLVITSRRGIEPTTGVDVQISASVRVGARVLVADATNDVAVLWVDPTEVAGLTPLSPRCTDAETAGLTEGQRLVALSAPLRGPKDLAVGEVTRLDAGTAISDLRLPPGGAGGPVFSRAGDLLGVSSLMDERNDGRRADTRVLSAAAVCAALRVAQTVRASVTVRPSPAHLPLDPTAPFPADALEAAATRRGGSLAPFQLSSSNFDVTLLTPLEVYAAQHEAASGASPARDRSNDRSRRTGPPTDFGIWSDYFVDAPPVLVIRATPRLEEGFWTTVGRAAAYTQGVALPPIKHFKPGFARMRLQCGDTDVAPIHPFTIDQRVSETDAIREGVYVYDAAALGPHCAPATLVLYSEKEPTKDDVRVIDRRVVEGVWDAFAPYRAFAGTARDVHP
jgi:hypothetical protein